MQRCEKHDNTSIGAITQQELDSQNFTILLAANQNQFLYMLYLIV